MRDRPKARDHLKARGHRKMQDRPKMRARQKAQVHRTMRDRPKARAHLKTQVHRKMQDRLKARVHPIMVEALITAEATTVTTAIMAMTIDLYSGFLEKIAISDVI